MSYFNETSPCGLDCFNCRVFVRNITGELKKELSEQSGLPEEQVVCKGCRNEACEGFHCGGCLTYKCVTQKGLDYCCDCDEFPCSKLAPTFHGAKYPHNMKMYNLSVIKRDGLEVWAEQAATIRSNYFDGEFVVGEGPKAK